MPSCRAKPWDPFQRASVASAWHGLYFAAYLVAVSAVCPPQHVCGQEELTSFRKTILPLLESHCYDCHGYGTQEGSVAFDASTPEEIVTKPELWFRVLKMIRAGMMPPAEMEPLARDERATLDQWIVTRAFHSDPENPRPGHVTLRRLNRVEYRNTIRDLMGIDYDTRANFPADDSGHGFDNIGQVLTMSPLLLEKYLDAARDVVGRAVPRAAGTPRVKRIPGKQFHSSQEESNPKQRGPRWLSYREPATISYQFHAEHAGTYRFDLDLRTDEKHVEDKFDYNRCQLKFLADGEVKLDREFSRLRGHLLSFTGELNWEAGDHALSFELEPLTPEEPDVRSPTVRINAVTIVGPWEEEFWIKAPHYERFFPRAVPDDDAARTTYAEELLREFATRAYRRPPGSATVERLVKLAIAVSAQEGQTFESGIAEAMIAVLASPRFLFREEELAPDQQAGESLFLDDWSLATRLSYFLWSTMPDAELIAQAAAGTLRENLLPQLERMLKDQRSDQLIENFVGQWLRARDVETALINGPEVARRDDAPDLDARKRLARFRALLRRNEESLTEDEKAEFKQLRQRIRSDRTKYDGAALTRDLRHAMRQETELLFERILRENRSVTELIDSDYTYLNERLAKHYGIPGVSGNEMRLVELPPESARGGVLTQGTMLVVTSNPDRTSPVKRGLFILDNILGTPPPPPPPNIPALEDAGTGQQRRTLTVAQALEIHRSDPLCSSCHSRMDPLGLALENFNALGKWRQTDRGQTIEAKGQLITGEEFTDVETLKKILLEDHRLEFYRCLTEKMLIYALGRGLDYHDVVTVDGIVNRLEQSGGKLAELIQGIVTSAPFLKTSPPEAASAPQVSAVGKSSGLAIHNQTLSP